MPVLVKAIIGLLIIAYPFGVYLGLLYFDPAVIGAVLVVLFLVRIASLYWQFGLERFYEQALPLCAVIVLLLVATVLNDSLYLKITPAIINAGCLAVFAWTLFRPPSMIERFARLVDADLPPSGVIYTRKVTMVWCVFFVINGAMALYTAAFASLETWAFYNGFVAYILMGILFGMEYLVRRRVKKGAWQG